tara:strand:+ start:109 stop:606 length:498 start_codon:yes stop_codon:yes gene_type:complete
MKVLEFMTTFGQNIYSRPQIDITKNDKDVIKLRLDLIEEEVKELREAIDTDNFTEIVDALSDILYVTYGAGGAIGVDLDNAFDIVHKSNMSKSCVSEDEADKTIQHYKDNPDLGYDTPDKRIVGDRWVVFNNSTGKVLKSINYTPADLRNPKGIINKINLPFVTM